jgi:ABC-type lipoprotein export system ATPase subunit
MTAPLSQTPVAELHGVTRHFTTGGEAVQALRGVDLSVRPGEMVVLQGRSGAGKTTLLNILVGLDDPTSGQALLLGQDLRLLSETARAELRSQWVGALFQNAHLFLLLTAQENVEVMLRMRRLPATERRQRARDALDRVGLEARAHHRALELSGGEQQRVALARAVVHRPQLLVADEPTGDLDQRTGREMIALLREMAHQHGVGLLVATHDANASAAADRIHHLHDGVLD